MLCSKNTKNRYTPVIPVLLFYSIGVLGGINYTSGKHVHAICDSNMYPQSRVLAKILEMSNDIFIQFLQVKKKCIIGASFRDAYISSVSHVIRIAVSGIQRRPGPEVINIFHAHKCIIAFISKINY